MDRRLVGRRVLSRRDPYAILEVPADASAADLKKAYRRLAREWHPDRNPGKADAEARFKEVASAWEIVGDPGRRRAFDARRGGMARGNHGDLPEEFLDAVSSAIERAQTWSEQVVVPHYASTFRGGGVEMAAQLIRDLPRLTDPAAFVPRITRLGRWRARRWLRDVQVVFDPLSSGASSLHVQQRRRFVIGFSPSALWRGGLRETVEIDDAILKLLVARYAQVLAAGRFSPPWEDSDVAWDQTMALARERDDREQGMRRFWAAVYAGVAALIVFMLFSGINGW